MSNIFLRASENNEVKIKCINNIVLSSFFAVFIMLLLWFCSYKYWHSFSQEKWLEYPEKRANMTADLFEDYKLVGMNETEIISLLGKNNNDYGYFKRENRFVYYLGNERTIIDSEWLLIDFNNGVVAEYSIMTD